MVVLRHSALVVFDEPILVPECTGQKLWSLPYCILQITN